MQAGQYITDGTAIFILDDVRDGNRVGDIVFRHVLRDGYIKANGATLKASEYPRLLAFVQSNNLTGTSSDMSKYYYDATAGTLRVPNVIDRVLQGGDTVAVKEAGLPNIVGEVAYVGYFNSTPNKGDVLRSGALTITNVNLSKATMPEGTASGFYNSTLRLDLSSSNSIYGNSTTVQPPAITLIPQIKY